jgi:hypothetical protein
MRRWAPEEYPLLMQLWEVPDRRSVTQYLKALSDEQLTEWCLRRLEREIRDPQGPVDGFDMRCDNGHLRSIGNLRFAKADGHVVCRACTREAKIRGVMRKRAT